MSIVTNSNRIGKFTSSEIYKLIGEGTRKMTDDELIEYKIENPKSQAKTCKDPSLFLESGKTYIKQKAQERKRKRSMSMDQYSRSTVWGNLMERRMFDIIGIEYKDSADITYDHPDFPNNWAGSVDLIVPKIKVAEVKAYEPIKFCDYADCLISQDLERLKNDFTQEYWQIVSNACIHKVDIGEVILYQPYDNEAALIAEMINMMDEPMQIKYQYFYMQIINHDLYKMPFQPDDSDYPNIVAWEFEIPTEDKQYLTSRVIEASKILSGG
jgi:hypothetical protein